MRSAENTGATAEIRPWPYEPSIAQIVLLDFSMVPDVDQVERWAAEALRQPSIERLRTSVLLPEARQAFDDAGFAVADHLALLERRIGPAASLARPVGPARLTRMGRRHLDLAAPIDRAAFPSTWQNDATSLAAIARATPHHRGRLALLDDHPAGFAITGRSGSVGYLQRFAVHPDAQGLGIGRQLVADALRWLQRRGVGTAFVNTGVDNVAALALYERCGFTRKHDDLAVMERTR